MPLGNFHRVYIGTRPQAPPVGQMLVHYGHAPTPDDASGGQWWHQKPDQRLAACECDAGAGLAHCRCPHRSRPTATRAAELRGMRAVATMAVFSHESMHHRAQLPLPDGRPIVFLLVGGRLVCPWQPRPEGSSTWQEQRIEAVRARLVDEVGRAGGLPSLGWVSAEDGVHRLPGPLARSCLARRLHDGPIVPARPSQRATGQPAATVAQSG